MNIMDSGEKCRWVREQTVDMALRLGDGRICSAMSHVEILVALYYYVMNVCPRDVNNSNKDRLILSKGHGVISLYPILADLGFFDVEWLSNFGNKDSLLGLEPHPSTPGIECITGSLGHGLPISIGLAISNPESMIYCVLGDCELFEGSNWESLFFVGSRQIKNLVCIIDNNKQGVLGYSNKTHIAMDPPVIEPLEDKFRAFGFKTVRIDGHDVDEITRAVSLNGPLIVIADTIKGKGLPLLEGQRDCHYQMPVKN